MLSYAQPTRAAESRSALQSRSIETEKSHICIAVPPTLPPSLAGELKRIFSENPGSRKVFLLVKEKGNTKKIETSFSIAFSSSTIIAIEKLVGHGAVQS